MLKKTIKKTSKILHLKKRIPKFTQMKRTEVLRKIKQLPWWEKGFDKWLSL